MSAPYAVCGTRSPLRALHQTLDAQHPDVDDKQLTKPIQGLQTLRQGRGLTIEQLLTMNTTRSTAIVSDQRLHAVSQYTPTCQAKFLLPVARSTIDVESLPKADLELMHNIVTKTIPTWRLESDCRSSRMVLCNSGSPKPSFCKPCSRPRSLTLRGQEWPTSRDSLVFPSQSWYQDGH